MKYTKWPWNIQNDCEIYHMNMKIPSEHEIYQMNMKFTKWTWNLPNEHEIYQMNMKFTKWTWNIPDGGEIFQSILFKDLPKHTKFGIFCMQIYHLASQLRSSRAKSFSCHKEVGGLFRFRLVGFMYYQNSINFSPIIQCDTVNILPAQLTSLWFSYKVITCNCKSTES
jgi:hypothetical protein